ncbi:MFS transporter [Salipiger sp. PrR002]|uniref:MFS transporter n=1 Tax=Salipiger sp. PrR002 TaxID=2706489 RepID=UPI0013BD4E81|nr:MFS transporter [Salipiger sp. PrR002]NDW02770.1 MFS transporter [Salipiger sp. PrR002]NDW60057.1 MFS transporter [Salipiger sp. PrR004]
MTHPQSGAFAGGLARVGGGIDRAWRVVGLDPHGFAQRQPERAERLAIWLLGVGATVGYGAFYYIFAALLLSWESVQPWGAEVGKGWLTLAFMCATLTGAAVSPFAGRMVDRGRGRWLLSGGMALGALSLLLLASAQSYWVFLLAWLGLGIAEGCCLYEPCFSFVTRTTHERARANITRITLVAGFASTLAYPSGAFLAEALGWRGAVLCFAGVVVLVGLPAMFAGATMLECCPEDAHTPERRAEDRAAFVAARARPEFWLILVAFSLIGLAYALLLTHIMPILTDRGLSLGQAVLAASMFGPMQVAGRLAMMLAGHRASGLKVAATSFSGILCAIAVLLFIVPAAPLAGFAFALLFGASFGLVSILKPVVMAEVLGRRAFGMIAGFMAVPFLIVASVAPQAGALLWRVGGYDLALWVALAAACLALVTLLVLIGRVPRSSNF